MSFVPAVAYHFRLNLPAAFTQPGARLSAEPCTRRAGEGRRKVREQSGPNRESRRSEMKEKKKKGDHSDWVSERDLGVACRQSSPPDRLRHRRLTNTTPDATTGFLLPQSRRERSRPGVAAAHGALEPPKPLSEETFCNWEFTESELGCSDICSKILCQIIVKMSVESELS